MITLKLMVNHKYGCIFKVDIYSDHKMHKSVELCVKSVLWLTIVSGTCCKVAMLCGTRCCKAHHTVWPLVSAIHAAAAMYDVVLWYFDVTTMVTTTPLGGPLSILVKHLSLLVYHCIRYNLLETTALF